MDVLLLLAPVLAAGLLSVFAVKKHTEQPNEKPGRLPIMILLLLPLTAGATYAYYLGAFFNAGRGYIALRFCGYVVFVFNAVYPFRHNLHLFRAFGKDFRN